MQEFLKISMATWVGTFISNLNGELVRELVVEAEDEVEAITRLDFYDYDETWEPYSLVDVREENSWTFLKALTAVISALANLRTLAGRVQLNSIRISPPNPQKWDQSYRQFVE